MEKKSAGIVAGIVVVAALLVIIFDRPSSEPVPMACTDDAKVCPDGTAVGRVGPRCEFAACPDTRTVPEKPDMGQRVSFDAEVMLGRGEVAIFPDGLSIQLKSISDSRCPVNVTCIWQGEISGTLIASRGALSAPEEVTVSSVTKPEISFGGYRMILVSGSESTIGIIVRSGAL